MPSLLVQLTANRSAAVSTRYEPITPLWGKMTIYQMVKHCVQWERWPSETQYRRSLSGRLFSNMALKNMLKDEPMKKGLPSAFVYYHGQGDPAAEKARWLQLIGEHGSQEEKDIVYPFFD